MKRSRGEVIAKILETCLIGASKTHVVYGSNLNFKSVRPYLDSLIANGYIAAIDSDPKEYKTTDKGKQLLAVIREAHEFF